MADFRTFSGRMNRRDFLGGAAAGVAGAGLTGISSFPAMAQAPALASYGEMYAGLSDGGHRLPAIPIDKMDQRYLRKIVIDPTAEIPGTVVVDTTAHFLYFVLPGRKAVRYGVSLGKAGFDWVGVANIQYKKAWPIWTPPSEMIERRPELAKYAKGMPPGPSSPLGARALYLFKNGKDTMYRLHGTPEWSSIGKNASSGCVRMLNQDVIDLFARVSGPTPVKVRHSMYLGANSAAVPATSAPTTEAIDAGVPEGAEAL
jgi:lipoprotein-anchoring transpeptidase ErfK/SrfK